MDRIINLKNALSRKGYPCTEFHSIQSIIDSELFDNAIIIEAISETWKIPILDIFSEKITILNFNKISEYSLHGYFICQNISNEKYLVISNPLLFENQIILKHYESYKIKLITKQNFYTALENNFSKLNTQKALLELGFLNPGATARNVNYGNSVTITLLLIMTISYLSHTIFVTLNYLIYISQILFKTWLFVDTYFNLQKTKKIKLNLLDRDYPMYSILVPMYKEENAVKSILKALEDLNYPKNRLDIKFVVEEDDEISLKIINGMNLPEYVHVIKVPYSEPRTKPKALNYAMQYITGSYVVIYDVEDVPDEDQLLKALDVFENTSNNLICVQAKLNSYNRGHNIISRLFSMEYSILFNFLLPGLDSSKMPIPLGGNSNHFRVKEVREIGLWDAYNVTEDADLGIRIFLYGYQTRMIDSYTMEEAPTDIKNWLHQRARWIKGFMQTFLVYWYQNSELKSSISVSGKVGIYLFLGFSTYSFFIMPWHLIAMCFNLTHGNLFLAIISSYITILYMYFTASVVTIENKNHIKKIGFLDWIALFIWPLYFILHIIASYKALYELVRKPFSWNKTKHDISTNKLSEIESAS